MATTRNGTTPSIWVTHASAVTALGDTVDATWAALLEGRTAIRPVRRFSTASYPVHIAACLEGLEPGTSGSMIEPLVNRAMETLHPLPRDTLLITATTKGPIDLWEAGHLGGGGGAETPLIPDFVECLTRKLDLQRPGFNISAACASATVAIAQACMRIASGNTEAALVVCADLVTEFVFSGFSALQILSDRPCTPFDRNRNGLSLGEGAAVICLMSPRRARMEGLVPRATLCGWGIAGDAAHITAPDRAGQGLIRAVRHAFRAAGCDPEEIAAVNAHGTGTVHNDRMELNAFRTLFGGRKIFIHSVKGGIGHTLGAAGGIELALSVKSLQEDRIPPTIGLSDPEPRGKGHIFSDPLALPPGCLLATNSGFGGVNAALVIDKGNGP